nr:CDP-alcohol phosphatidyltransferase family protein [uncultured Porphyromonas sp.]
MQLKKHIPNAITCCNLLSGVAAVVLTLRYDQPEWAAWCVVLAAVFDFFDGLVARALGVSSPIGKDLDSLADVISFGLAPSVLVWSALEAVAPGNPYSYGAFVLAPFAALRLAKFNNDTRQTTSFRGLPVPSNALFWLGMSPAVSGIASLLGVELTIALYLLLSLALSFLMVSELPMFSFKLKPAPLRSLWPQLTLIVVTLAAVAFLGWLGCSVAIATYLLLSLFASREA